ncbi:MAG: DUF3035 domain-containing protein [Alphaproteobacteria bacterium]|nr:DUF3035 domain-containing protein [Alphaproteobacteria bacterium]
MRPIVTPLLLCTLLGLAGCGSDLSRSFGLTRDSPDEFLVTPRAPLSMPPSYVLARPQPGAPRPQELSPRAAVESTLTQSTSSATGAMSPGQTALLQAAGPPPPADIRAQVNRQAGIDDPAPGFVDKMQFWLLPREPGVIVDPNVEAQRLRENAALGKTVQDGETRIIMPKRKSIFGF